MRFSAFSVNTVFAVLMLLGVAVIPRLSLQLEPSSRSNELNVSFSWANANPELLEMEVTTKLEGAFARVRGLDEISSMTRNGNGYISLLINKNEDINAAKLYLSSIIRSVAPELPEGVRVSAVGGGEMRDGRAETAENMLLLSYVITGPGASLDVARFAEDNLASVLSLMPGVGEVSVSGAVPFEWVMEYDRELFADIGLTPSDISMALSRYYMRYDAGKVLVEESADRKYAYILFKGNPDDNRTDILQLPIKVIDGKIMYLRDLVTLDYREQEARSFYRINGLNRINLNVFAARNTNMIELAGRVRGEMERLMEGFSDRYSVKLMRDNSKEIKNELNQILYRTLATVLILLLFVWLISRDVRYLGIIALSLTANILIAMVFYYLLKIELHLYTLAGITVSFGIIIDSVIVMTDHYRHHHNRKAFLAILAATLTTMGALTVIFNLDGSLMKDMWDFSAVIIINLAVSLAVAFFFVPALMEKWPLREPGMRRRYRQRRRVVRFNRFYRREIAFSKRFPKWILLVAILAFGLPVFLLPNSVSREEWYSKSYNAIFGSEFYLTIKPYVNKVLGGSLRLFVENEQRGAAWGSSPSQKNKTRLTLEMVMPHGATIAQMNEAFQRLENFLTGFEEIEDFTTTISSANRGNLVIHFKEEHEKDGSPERLKNELIRYANTIGNGDSSIEGVGRGFSNRTADEYRSESLKVLGYNYRKVMEYAHELKNILEQNIRVKKLYIGSDERQAKVKEYAIDMDRERLARSNSSTSGLLRNLQSVTYSGESVTQAFIHNEYTRMAIRPRKRMEATLWDIRNRPLRGNRSTYRLDDVGRIAEDQAFETIRKQDQEYEVSVLYDFIGAYALSDRVKKRAIEEMNAKMAVGYRVKESDRWRSYWDEMKVGGIDARIIYILLVLGIIFFICSILLESLRQAWVVICIAPISFIGCFLGCRIFGIGFDQGCLAAFILLSGLSVNSVLYILNDYNIRLRQGRARTYRVFIQAYNAKIIPVILTIASTLLGFVPFLIGDINPFWRSLAIGTMSGLLFSLPVLIIYLPILLKLKKS